MRKRLVATLLVLCMVLGMLPGTAWAADTNPTTENCVFSEYIGSNSDVVIPEKGTSNGEYTLTEKQREYIGGLCGKNVNNVTWQLVLENDYPGRYILYIRGSGDMYDFDYWERVPWYSSREYISRIVIEPGVTSIGSFAFYGCTAIEESIVLPNSITNIGRMAFYNCRAANQNAIVLPDSVTHIADLAFASTTYYMDNARWREDGVHYIDHYLIRAKSSAMTPGSYKIREGTIGIADGAFDGLTSMTSVSIPNSVTRIGCSAFSDCTSLTDVTIPDSVTSIGMWAFGGCTGLTDVTIPGSVTSIVYGMFRDCTSLTDITIPSGITNFGDSAFSDCTSLTTVIMPNSVTSIGDATFYNCRNLIDVYYNGNKSQWDEIEIGDYNDCFTSATIHYNSSGPGTEVTDPAGYAYFGKLDSYDYNGSAIIDGVKYSFTEEFKNSPDNLQYLSTGNYLDSYVYAMFNLNEASQITSLKYTTGIPCKLENWNAYDSIVDTSLTPISILPIELKPGDYRVSEITKGSFPTDQIADWIGDDIRVYTRGEEIFKLIHIEHKAGVVTAFDPNGSPLTIYIDDVAYPVVGKDKDLVNTDLVNAIRYPSAKVAYTLYDGVLVEVVSKADMNPSVGVGAGSNTLLSYKNGVYEQYKTGADNRISINVANSVKEKVYGWGVDSVISSDIMGSISDFDITIEAIQLTGNDIISIPYPYNTAIEVPKDKQLLHAGDSYTMSVPFTFNNGHVPYEGEKASVGCIVTGKDSNGNPITLRGSISFTVKSVTGGGPQPPDQDDADLDALRNQLDGMTAVSLTHSELADHFSQKEVRSIEKFLTVYITQMVNAPKVEEDQTFLQDVKKSVKKKAKEKLYKAMNINESADLVKVDNLSSSVQVKKGRTTVNFDIKVSTYAWNGFTFGGFGQINFKIDGTNRTGTGIVTYADTKSFSDAVMRYVKAGYNEAWGKDADKIVEAFLPKTINDLLSKTGSFSDKVFTLLTEPAKKYRKKLSVKAAADIYVYGANGTLLGSIVGGNIQNDGGNISCSLQGDTKEIFLEYGECIIKIVGSETEMITCTVEEYSEGRVSRTVSFENVALSRGVSYESNLTEQINIPVSEYVLRSNTGAIIPATRDENGTLSSGQPGDLTGDGKVTMADVIRLARGAAGYVTLTEQEQKVGDVNRDSKITMADVIRVARYAAGYSPAV